MRGKGRGTYEGYRWEGCGRKGEEAKVRRGGAGVRVEE